jgi:hypothetical protein
MTNAEEVAHNNRHGRPKGNCQSYKADDWYVEQVLIRKVRELLKKQREEKKSHDQ